MLSNPVPLVLFDTLNLTCVEDAFPFVNKYPYAYSHAVPRSTPKNLHVTCHELKP